MAYDESWDRPHAPGPESHWQESDCYWFLDVEQRIGGFHRIGQTPNTGDAHIMLFAFDANGERYLNTRAVPSADADRWDDGQRVETHRAEFLGDQRLRYQWDEPDCTADLEFCDGFYTPRDWTLDHATDVERVMNPGGHLECDGRLRGKIRIGARTYDIDALAHRDRSWGPREWKASGQSKMYSGTIGRELSWATYAFQLRDTGAWVQNGFVARNGVTEQVNAVRVIATYDTDSFTVLGGEGRLTLASGESLRIPFRPVQSMMTQMADFAATDTLSIVDVDGRLGFVDCELLMNPGRGPFVGFPSQDDVSFVCVERGLSQSATYDYEPFAGVAT